MTELDQLNTDSGNLDLQDTRELIYILDLLERGQKDEAMFLLDEFIVRRGYDETLTELAEEKLK